MAETIAFGVLARPMTAADMRERRDVAAIRARRFDGEAQIILADALLAADADKRAGMTAAVDRVDYRAAELIDLPDGVRWELSRAIGKRANADKERALRDQFERELLGLA